MRTIQEYLIDALRSTYLYEMAKNQSQCEDTVRGQCVNILENTVLLNYFMVSRLHTTNFEHWKNELTAAIFNAGKFNIKKDKSIERRRRLVHRVFDEEDMYSSEDILYAVTPKMYKEKEIRLYDSMHDEWIGEAISNTLNQMQDISELIVLKDAYKTKQYINNTYRL